MRTISTIVPPRDRPTAANAVSGVALAETMAAIQVATSAAQTTSSSRSRTTGEKVPLASLPVERSTICSAIQMPLADALLIVQDACTGGRCRVPRGTMTHVEPFNLS